MGHAVRTKARESCQLGRFDPFDDRLNRKLAGYTKSKDNHKKEKIHGWRAWRRNQITTPPFERQQKLTQESPTKEGVYVHKSRKRECRFASVGRRLGSPNRGILPSSLPSSLITPREVLHAKALASWRVDQCVPSPYIRWSSLPLHHAAVRVRGLPGVRGLCRARSRGRRTSG